MIRGLVDIHDDYGGTRRIFACAPDLPAMREGIRLYCQRQGIACAGFTIIKRERVGKE